MLKTRIITALVLLAVILPILFSGLYPAFAVLALVFFTAAIWESQRLFGQQQAIFGAALWALLYAAALWQRQFAGAIYLFGLCCGIWGLRFSSNLALGLPALNSLGNRLLNNIYNVAILGCFVALVALFMHSPQFLLSCMALVWIADVGAYFSGKAFGKRKLAVTISPGKSWEGAIGGALAVLLISSAVVWLSADITVLQDTLMVAMQKQWGWLPMLLVLCLISAASVVGDLVESQLKRRVQMKDSSNLLPGHGGVLDRIDALIPVLPLAAMLDLILRM